MSYCFNPDCSQPNNEHQQDICNNCGANLLFKQRYRAIRSLSKSHLSYTLEVVDRQNKKLEVNNCTNDEQIKVLKILLTNYDKAIELFQQEARILSSINCPEIPKIVQDGYFCHQPAWYHHPLHCLVIEKIAGTNLEQWLNQNQSLSLQQAQNWLRQLLDILELLHQQQYFHRDIKPSNIILQPNGRLALIDFGAARKVTDTYLGKIGVNQGVTSIRTPGYIAPEQLDGAALPQSDFFSLGRTLVHLVTGKHPQSFAKNLELENIVWRSQAPQISVAFGDLLDLMMSHSPSKRPINVKSIRAILAQAEDYPHQSVSRLRPKRRLQAPKSSLILVWLLALFGLVSLGKNFQQQQVAISQENTPLCNNLTCINRDPIDNKCDRDAQTITSNIGNYLLGGKSMAYKIEVRYSPLCNAVWARSQAPYRSYHYIEDSEGKTYGKVRVIRDGWNRHYADMAPGKDIEIRACAEPPIGQINCTNFVAL